jgi:hypothetical protein
MVALKRTRVFVDSQRRAAESRDEFDISFVLPEPIEDVRAIELVDFNVPRDISPTFVASEPGLPGNNLLDVRLVRKLDGSTLDFTVTLEPNAHYATHAAMVLDVVTQINAAMDAQGHGYFNTAGGVLVGGAVDAARIVEGAEQALTRFWAAEAGDLTKIDLTFRFGSGPSRGFAPERVLGFDEGADTVVPTDNFFGTGVFYERRGYKAAALVPYRFVDVFVAEAGPLPLARISLNDPSYTRDPRQISRPRPLTTPVRVLRAMTIRLRLEDGRRPVARTAHDGWDLVFDVLSRETGEGRGQWHEAVEREVWSLD